MYCFIIPAHNEEQLLPRTLRSIHSAAKALGEPYEIIVANDASADATEQIAKQHGAKVVNVDNRQISKTRNSGATEAVGDVLIFVDADTTINESVLRAVQRELGNGAIGGGAAVSVSGSLPFFARWLAPAFTFCYRKAGLAAGCFVYATRSAFDTVGGFDETLFASEEITFSRAMRRQGRFVVIKEAVFTSGRKLRTYGFWEHMGILFRMALAGPKSVKSRDLLGLWYDERREDKEG